MIPMPDRMATQLEAGLVAGSAEVAAWFFRLSGVPMLRDRTTFALPGITLHIAQECSGIRSTWVLFITSLLAAHTLLRGAWRRWLLLFFVIPLGLVRNAFRILVIGLLCVYVGPEMSDSFIHRHGGPLFFVVSLVPLFGLLWWLRPQQKRLDAAR
jgi:exosortase